MTAYVRSALGRAAAKLVGIPEVKWLLGVSALAFAVRLAWILYSPCLPVRDYLIYDMYARRLAEGSGYVTGDGTATAYWPVGYPLFLAGIYALVGHAHFAVKFANALLGVIAVVLTYRLGTHVTPGVARIASAMLAVWPSQVGIASVLASENLFTPLLLAYALSLVKAGPRVERLAWVPVSGAILGAACLVRPAGLVLGPAGIVWWGLFARNARQARRCLLGAAVLVGAVTVMLAPWMIRNAHVLKAFVPLSTNGGTNLLVGNNPYATGRYVELPASLLPRSLEEVERNKVAFRMALSYMKSHPRRTAILGLRKVYSLFSRDTAAVGWMQFTSTSRSVSKWERYGLAVTAQLYYLAAMGLAIVGAVRSDKRTPVISLLFVIIGLWIALHMVFFGEDRFHNPIIPCLAIFASLPVSSGFARLGRLPVAAAASVFSPSGRIHSGTGKTATCCLGMAGAGRVNPIRTLGIRLYKRSLLCCAGVLGRWDSQEDGGRGSQETARPGGKAPVPWWKS